MRSSIVVARTAATVLLSFLLLGYSNPVAAESATIAVKGLALCRGERAVGAIVELWEKDMFSKDLISNFTTRADGEFAVVGSHKEIGQIQFVVTFNHTCGSQTGCRRLTKYAVPREFHNRLYDMFYISLDIRNDEKEECEIEKKQ